MAFPPADRNERAATIALVLVLLVGLGLRVLEAWDGRPPVYDAAAYATIAERLADGDGFTLGAGATQPASNYSPGLPLLVGAVYELSGGAHERLARLMLVVLGTLAILFAYLIGRRLSGPVAGLIGAAAVAVYPALLEYQGMLMGEPLAAALLSAAVWAMLWAAEGKRERWFAPGLLLGALVLVRPEYLGIGALLAIVVLAWDRDEWRRGLASAGVLLVGVALVVAPWTARNAVVLDRLVPVSTGGGQVLFAGSYLPSGGDPERVGEEVLDRHPELRRELPPDPRLEQILVALAEQRHPGLPSDEALGRMGRERLWEELSTRPLDYVAFLGAKAWRAWSRGPREVMEQSPWRAFHLVLVALALTGLAVLALRRRPEALLFGVLLLAVTAIVALLVASPRRVLVTMPLLAALAGVGATALADSLSRRWRT
jgi:4-amino-4-deoxy-L-arabinose transferase-like glycosyltransferase